MQGKYKTDQRIDAPYNLTFLQYLEVTEIYSNMIFAKTCCNKVIGVL